MFKGKKAVATKEEKKENQEVRCGPEAKVLSYLKIRIKKKLSDNQNKVRIEGVKGYFVAK